MRKLYRQLREYLANRIRSFWLSYYGYVICGWLGHKPRRLITYRVFREQEAMGMPDCPKYFGCSRCEVNLGDPSESETPIST